MKNRKAWKILKSLSDDERRRFSHWLASELDGKQHFIRQLNAYLLAQFPQAPDANEIWAKLYPNEAFDDARFRKLTRDLTRWLEEFLAIESFRKERDQRDLYLLRGLYERQLDDLFEKQVRKLDKELEGRKVQDSRFFRMRYEVEWLTEEFENARKKELDRPAFQDPSHPDYGNKGVQRAQSFFDLWWTQEKLYLATTILSNVLSDEKTAMVEAQSFLLKEVVDKLSESESLRQQPLLNIYRRVYLLLTRDEQVSIESLLADLQQQKQHLLHEDFHTLWVQLVNYYVRLWNRTGDNQFGEPLTTLFEWAIDADFLLVEGYLPEVYYKNLVGISLRLKQDEKAFTRIHQYRTKLRPEIAGEVFLLTLSNYHIYKAEFEEVISLLRSVKFSRSLDEIRARANLIEASFGLNPDDHEWLLGQTDNLIRFIRRKSYLPFNKKKPLINQYQLFKRIIKAYDKTELNSLIATVEQTHPLSNSDWLKDKITQKLEQA